VIFLTNNSPISTELFSELFSESELSKFLELAGHKLQTPHEAWTRTCLNSKIFKMIDTNTYIHTEGPELKKAGKTGARSKKITLVSYRNQFTYCLYNRKADKIILSSNIDFNKKLTRAKEHDNDKTLSFKSPNPSYPSISPYFSNDDETDDEADK
jgi:hypothetical protein